MNPLQKQAMKVVNQCVEDRDGNWREARKDVLCEIDVLLQNGSIGAKAFAYVLDDVYRELAPVEAYKTKGDENGN